jgi:hypothetical protein
LRLSRSIQWKPMISASSAAMIASRMASWVRIPNFDRRRS